MRSNLFLSTIAPGFAATLSLSLNAAQPVSLQNVSLDMIARQYQIVMPGVTQANMAPSDHVLQFVRQHTDNRKVHHIRLQQQYKGFPVFGGYAIIHGSGNPQTLLTGKAQPAGMNGVIYKDLEVEGGLPSPDFVRNGLIALEKMQAPYLGNTIDDKQVVPIVYIDDQHQAHWAYKVSFMVSYDDRIPVKPVAIVDANTFKPYVQWDDIKTESARRAVKGIGSGGNSKIGEIFYGKTLAELDIGRDDEAAVCYMENVDVKVVDMRNKSKYETNPMQFNCPLKSETTDNVFLTGYEADGYDRENGAYSPTNDALYTGYVIKHMYHDWYALEALTKKNGSPMQLVMRVHYGHGYENAYWDGDKMTFGDGKDWMYPLVSLGIGAHEVSHGFTEQHSDLVYHAQAGGMNEAFSDMAAQAAEFYSTGTNSWLIGAEILKEGGEMEAIRYMDMPSRDGESIDKASDYYPGMDVHNSSGVYNRLFYLIATQSGWDTRKAFDLMVKANVDYWTPYTTFDQGACGILSAAKDLGYDQAGIRSAMSTVGVHYGRCK